MEPSLRDRIFLFFRDPIRQGIAIIVIALAIYFYLGRPTEYAGTVVLNNNIAIVSTGGDGLRFINIANPDLPTPVGFYDSPTFVSRFTVNGSRAFIADGAAGVQAVQFDDGSAPSLLFQLDTPGTVRDVIAEGNILYVADSNFLRIYGQSSATAIPALIVEVQMQGDLTVLKKIASTILAGDRNGRLYFINVADFNQIEILGVFETRDSIWDIATKSNIVYLAQNQAGLRVIDASDPSQAQQIQQMTTESGVRSVRVDGSYLYMAESNHGLRILDVTNPSSPTLVGNLDTPGEASGLDVRGGYVYLADGYDGLRVIRARALLNPGVIGESPQKLNFENLDVAGRYVFMAAGERGIRIFDAAIPSNINEINAVDTPGYAQSVTVSGDLAFVADRTSGLQVYDISDLQRPIEPIAGQPSVVDTNDVDVQSGIVYVADGRNGLAIFDYRIPSTAYQASTVDTPGNANGITIFENRVYIADGPGGLQIIDARNLSNPFILGQFDTNGDSQSVVVTRFENNNRIYAFLADGSAGLRILDVSNPAAISQVALFEVPDFAEDIAISGQTAYLAGRLNGMVVIDVSTISQPREVTRLGSPGQVQAITLEGPQAFVADFSSGLAIYDISQPLAPVEIGVYDTPARVIDAVTLGAITYLVDGERGLWVMDTSDQGRIRRIGFTPTRGQPLALTVLGNRAYVADGTAGLTIVDVTQGTQPQVIGNIDTQGISQGVSVIGNLAFLADGATGLGIFDITDPAAIQVLSNYPTGGDARHVTASGRYAIVSMGPAGVRIINIANPNQPTSDSLFQGALDAQATTLTGQTLLVADGRQGLLIVDFSRPVIPVLLSSYIPGPSVTEVTIAEGQYVFASADDGNVYTLDVANPANPVEAGSFQSSGEAGPIHVIGLTANAGQQVGFRGVVAYDEEGLRIFQAAKSYDASMRGSYETPGSATPEQALRAILGMVRQDYSQLTPKVRQTFLQVGFDLLVIGIGSFGVWLTILGWFVLPVTTWLNRSNASERLWAYYSGGHGPAMAVRDGKIIAREGENRRPGPGVVRVDPSSAVLIERRTIPYPFIITVLLRSWNSFTAWWRRLFRLGNQPAAPRPPAQPTMRVAGPGINFTNYEGIPALPGWYEVVTAAADLHPQTRGAADVRATTKDGIDVESRITTVFSLGEAPDVLYVTYEGERSESNVRVVEFRDQRESDPAWPSGFRLRRRINRLSDELEPEDKRQVHRYLSSTGITNTWTPIYRQNSLTPAPYVFDPERIFAALSSQARNISNGGQMDWTELPVFAAVEIFRNLITQYRYEDLYALAEEEGYPLTEVRGIFRKQVRNLGMLNFQAVMRVDGQLLSVGDVISDESLVYSPVQSFVNPQLLRMRGVKIISASFGELRPTVEVDRAELERLEREEPESLQRIMRQRWQSHEEAGSERRYSASDRLALEQAQRVLNDTHIEWAKSLVEIAQDNKLTDELMLLQFFQALERAAEDSENKKLSPGDTLAVLRDLRGWLLPGSTGLFNGEFPDD